MSKKNLDVSKELLSAIQDAKNGLKMELSLQTTKKNNGVEKESIVIGAGDIRPNIYIDHELERIKSGESTIQESANAIIEKINSIGLQEGIEVVRPHVKEMMENPDISKIFLQISNRKKNEELLRERPHRNLADDLSLIARYRINDEGSVIITTSLASEVWGMTSAEIIEAGAANIKNEGYQVQTLSSIISEMMGVPENVLQEMQGFEKEAQMYVVTNQSRLFGATGIFIDRDLREQVANKIGRDYLIIPSSIHETLALPADLISPEEARDMIISVNNTELAEEEFLSDHPYLVNAETLKISNPCESIVDVNLASEKMKLAAHM